MLPQNLTPPTHHHTLSNVPPTPAVVHIPGYDEYTYWAVKILHLDVVGSINDSPYTSAANVGATIGRGKDVQICSPDTSLFGGESGCFAIVDSGSGLTLVPKSLWMKFMDAIVPGESEE